MNKIKKEIYLSDSCKVCLKTIKKMINEEENIKCRFDNNSLLLLIEGDNEEVLNEVVEKTTNILRKHRHEFGLDSSDRKSVV